MDHGLERNSEERAIRSIIPITERKLDLGRGSGREGFIRDLNGKLYVLDKTTRQFATYLDFQRNTAESPNATGLFPALLGRPVMPMGSSRFNSTRSTVMAAARTTANSTPCTWRSTRTMRRRFLQNQLINSFRSRSIT